MSFKIKYFNTGKIPLRVSIIICLFLSGTKNFGQSVTCEIKDLPSIQFPYNHTHSDAVISIRAQQILETVAITLKNNPGCKLKVTGHTATSKAGQQLANDRVENIIRFLVEKKGISQSRFIFNYDGGTGDPNIIDLYPSTEAGPNNIPAPHPNLKKN